MENEWNKEGEENCAQEDSFRSFVVEKDELLQLVVSLGNEEVRERDDIYERISIILEKYQEQPQLLDKHLESLLSPLILFVRSNFNNATFLNRLLKLIYVFTKVRGYKTIEKFFSHEVADLEPTFALLQAQNPQDYSTWETRYILFLWLSIIILIPFNLNTVDSMNEGDSPLLCKIIELGKSYLNDSGRTRDAAVILLSRALTRPDFSSEYLKNFFSWCDGVLSSKEGGQFLITGVLGSLAAIFKRGKRQELLDWASVIFKNLNKIKLSSATHRKLYVNLIQRIGLTYLKPRVAPWRYQRGNRSLLQNLGKTTTSIVSQPQFEEIEEEEENIPEEIEEIIEILLNGLKDKDTIVRWSAAKGIGRITNRLPQELGDEVVASLLELFSVGEGDTAWHGGCLAFAELARRGLLLPKRLDDVLPLLIKALQYDERRGSHSVGSHVRDSACYVCWAFARAYSPEVMAPHVFKLANALMVTAVYDREINCRRAASAAFQENVGRQGNFPHGIDIFTAADYFSLSNRTESYTKIAVFVARFEEYRKSLVDHLVDIKIQHWEKSLRELTSKALSALVHTDPTYFHDQVLPKLITTATSSDLNLRHGSILGVAEVVFGLHLLNFDISKKTQEEIVNIVPLIEHLRLYRGKGGEIVRQSVCRLIEVIAIAKIPLSTTSGVKKEKPIGPILQASLDENLKHVSEEIRIAAVAAVKAFSQNCYSFPPKKAAFDLVERYLNIVATDENPAARRGHALALGVLPKEFVMPSLDKVISIFINATVENLPKKRDAETRRNAVIGLRTLCESVGLGSEGLSQDQASTIFKAFLITSRDYATDNRGDVGSWVREASMIALQKLTHMMVDYDTNNQLDIKYLTPELVELMECAIFQQAMEKIDRIRDCAGKIFFELLYHSPTIPHLPHHSRLKELFPSDTIINWGNSAVTFPIFIKLLAFPAYRESLLLGLIPSLGGITQSLVLDSSNILLEYIKELKETRDQFETMAACLLAIFTKNFKNDRIIVPLIKVFSHLLSHGCFDTLQPSNSPFSGDLLKAVQTEITGSKEIVKVMGSIYVFCWLLLFDQPTRNQSFLVLLGLLVHPFPKVRKLTAEEMYVRILTDEQLVPTTSYDEIQDILSTTNWLESVTTEMKEKRDKLYDLLNIPKPKIVKKAIVSKSNQDKPDDNYKDLVRETGY